MRPRHDLAFVLSRTKRARPPRGVRGPCRIWQGSRTRDGYGNVRTGPSSWDYAHRIVLAATGRPVPRGKVADHLCRRRACCAPAHLRVATYSQNNLEGWRTRRAASRRAGPVRSPKRRRIVPGARVRRTGDPQVPRPRALA